MQADAPPDNPRLALAVARILGLAPLHQPNRWRCMGKANGCIHECCNPKLAKPTRPRRVRQPWDPS